MHGLPFSYYIIRYIGYKHNKVYPVTRARRGIRNGQAARSFALGRSVEVMGQAHGQWYDMRAPNWAKLHSHTRSPDNAQMSKRGVRHPTGVQPVRHDYSAHEHRTCNSALAATRTRTGECLGSACYARVSLDGPPGARLTLRAFRLSRTWQRASASEA